MSAPTDTTSSLSDRLAALRDRMGTGSDSESLASTLAQFDEQQSNLLSIVAALTEDVQDLAPRLVAELQALLGEPTDPLAELGPRLDALDRQLRSLTEVVTENADAHESTIAGLRAALPTPVEVPDQGPRLDRVEQLLSALAEEVTETADAHQAALTGLSAALPAPVEVPDLGPRFDQLERHLAALSGSVQEGAEAHRGALADLVATAVQPVDPTPWLASLEGMLRSLTDTVEAQADAHRRAIDEVHEHIDAAALAIVEAVLSAR